MKKIISLAALFAVLSYASPASAELKLGGEAGVRLRGDFGTAKPSNDKEDLSWQYRIALKPSADLGDGYFAKALIQSEDAPGGWLKTGAYNTEKYNLNVSQFYFGHNDTNSHWVLGRIPLGTFDNPILDLTLYAIPAAFGTANAVYAVDIPIFLNHFDRLLGFNYGTKIGGGELNAVIVNFDNLSNSFSTSTTDRGAVNDGYGFTANYKTTIGDLTIVPQAYVTLTHTSDGRQPYTLGAQAFIPAGKSKVALSGFYTADKNTYEGASFDYSGYIFRVKGESGPVTAWVDYNQSKDKLASTDYDNLFVWASYNLKVHQAATGTFSLTPTVRYRASGKDTGTITENNNLLRAELYATVTF
ncbi:MAG: hypothetical protein WCK32_08905 [Chlorobiaceae bacterium]